VEGKPYDSIESVTFSPDGRRLAYAAKRGQKQLMVVDGVEGPEYASVETPQAWSPDSRRLAYVARQEDFQRCVVVDGVRAGPYGGDRVMSPVFSPDSKHWAVLVEQGYANFLVFDGKRGPTYNSTDADTLSPPMVKFSPDGRRVAYVVGGSSSIWRPQRVVVESVEGIENKDKAEVHVGKVYDGGVGGLIFSPDSRRLAYVASRAAKSLVVTGSIEGPGYYSVELGGLFSPDGRRTAYKVGSYDEKTSWRYAAVIDGTLSKPYLSMVAPPLFSPDSAHVALLTERHDDKYVIVVDGEESQPYDDYAGDGKLVFDGPNLLRAVMVRNGEGLRVEIRIR